MPYAPNGIYRGDARALADHIVPESVALSVWSPPYYVGKEYERHLSFDEWQALLRDAICAHRSVLRPGGFLAINIADILCLRDPSMPRLMADNVALRRRSDITRDLVLETWARHPEMNRRQIAALLGCSEQTVDRRMKGNNIRGGKYQAQTRVYVVGGLIQEFASQAGLFLYDRRVWVKDPAWENCRWHSLSYRAVDEFEYLYVFWKPGPTRINRGKLKREEWKEWGSRAVWTIPSVRANDNHEAKFPLELPRRAIRLFTEPGDLVLDCFVGSGTSVVAAVMEGRQFIGIDTSAKCAAMARAAVAEAQQESAGRLHFDAP